MTRVRVRGIYATALTQLLGESGHTVVQPSGPIRDRFDRSFPDEARDATVETTADRQGVGVVGEDDAVAAVTDAVASAGIDALRWADPTPSGAVYDGRVTDTLGGGAVVDVGEGEGYLPFDAVDGYVDEGDRVRVRVDERSPPWADDRPTLSTEMRVSGGLAELVRGRDRTSADLPNDRANELARTLDLLSTDVPDGWGVHWTHAAGDADMTALDDALARAADRAADLAAALDDAPPVDEGDVPRTLATPVAGRWVWFGRTTRFALDDRRREVTATMAGHHRVKAAHRAASSAVDLVEAVCADPTADGDDPDFPFEAVAEQYGPREGDRVAIGHGKPDGRLITLGHAEVTERGADGKVTLRREMRSSGEYDGLGTAREPGDVAVTRIKEGRWWYPTVYRGDDGEKKGTYVNVCTPVEVFPDEVRYVDLHVDVVRQPDGTVERVDDDELDAAVEAGDVPEPLAEKARDVAERLDGAL